MSNKNFGISLRSAVLILVLLVSAIGLTGVLYSRSTKQVQEVTLQEPILETIAAGTQSTVEYTEPSSAPAATTPVTLPAMVVDPTETEATVPALAPTEQRSIHTAAPVSGKSIGEYAMECLSYNETTRDWRVHNGIDLAAEPGSPVCAAADGTVYTTYEDDALGHTVVIRHEGGYTTRYSSLAEDLCVAPGDKVTLGQTIGYADDSALVESVMGAHVHFSVSCQDQPMNPEEFLALG